VTASGAFQLVKLGSRDRWRLPVAWAGLSVAALLVPQSEAGTAWVFLGIAAAPILLWLKSNDDLYLPLALVAAAYLVGIPLQVLVDPEKLPEWPIAVANTYKDLALRWMLEGFLVFVFAYLIGRGRGVARLRVRSSRETIDASARATRLLTWCGTVGTAAMLVVGRGDAYTFGQDLEQKPASSFGMLLQLGLIAAPVAVFMWERAAGHGILTRKDPAYVALWLVVCVWMVGAGTKGVPMLLLLAVFLPRVLTKRKSAVRFALLLLGAIASTLIIFSVFTNFREVAGEDLSPHAAGLFENLRFQGDVMKEAAKRTSEEISDGTVFGFGGGRRQTRVEQAVSRLSGSSLGLATAIQLTQAASPLENLEWVPLLPVVAFVPRDVWPEKPEFMNSGRFATMLGWNRPLAPVGGISIGLSGSLYWLGGHGAIGLGMGLFGWCVAVTAVRAQSRPAGGWFWQAMVFCLVCNLINVGLEATSLVVGTIRMSALLALLEFLAQRRWHVRTDG